VGTLHIFRYSYIYIEKLHKNKYLCSRRPGRNCTYVHIWIKLVNLPSEQTFLAERALETVFRNR